MNFDGLTQTLTDKLNELEGNVGLAVKFVNSNELFIHNENVQFWAASVIKIPIALTFYKKFESTEAKLAEKTNIDSSNYVYGSGIVKLLDKNLQLTHKDLLTLMLVVSDNTATNQIIDVIGWESVEEYMQELGLKNTTFKHKMMIKARRGPNLTTPMEMVLLLEKMYKKELPGSEIILGIMQEQLDRTRIPLYIPNEIAISHKNGSLPEALHEVGVVYSKNPFIFCFFSEEQKDKRKTNLVLAECAKYCFDYSNLKS